jgi:hypothetical protein
MSFKSRNFKKTLALMLSVASIGGGAKNAANAAQKRGENSSQSQSWIAKNPGMTALIGILGLGTLAGGGYFVKNKFFSKNTKNNNNLGNDNVPNINIQPKIIENKEDFQNINVKNIETQPKIVNQTIENSVPDYEKIAKEEWDKMNLGEKNDFAKKKMELKDKIQKILSPYKNVDSLSENKVSELGQNVTMLGHNLPSNKKYAQISSAKYVFENMYEPLFLESNVKFEKDITTKDDLNNNILRFRKGELDSIYQLNSNNLNFKQGKNYIIDYETKEIKMETVNFDITVKYT